MKKSTKIVIAIILVIVIILVAIGVKVILDLKQEKALDAELESVYSSLDKYPLKYDELDEKLSRTVTTGNYKDVEVSIKAYISFFVNSVKDLDSLFDSEDIISALSAENYKNDGSEFIETRKNLAIAKTELERISNDLSSFFTEEKALEFIADKNLDNYYLDFYKKYTIIPENDTDGNNEIAQAKEDLSTSLEDFKKLVSQEQDVIDFLVKNKNNWKIDGDQIVFSTEKLSNDYNKLISEI